MHQLDEGEYAPEEGLTIHIGPAQPGQAIDVALQPLADHEDLADQPATAVATAEALQRRCGHAAPVGLHRIDDLLYGPVETALPTLLPKGHPQAGWPALEKRRLDEQPLRLDFQHPRSPALALDLLTPPDQAMDLAEEVDRNTFGHLHGEIRIGHPVGILPVVLPKQPHTVLTSQVGA
ncbi:hypothetical protein [Zestomonas thermotolerans]|uniref:hypothetical protein n=1 Tax=Zestomonas thermotolerans TaxID=157784 RepID=UPI000487E29F|nr:hypothetical protein [Pseudomonas thermotolerans]